MAEISYKEFEAHVKSLKGDDFKPVYLIHGEEFLFKSAFDALLDRMVPKENRSFGYEPADEDSESMADVIERLNTFSLMPGTKVVSLCESKVFYSRDDNAGLVKKIKAAWDKGERKKAVSQLGSLLALADLSLDEADSTEGIDALKLDAATGGDPVWFKDLVRHAREQEAAPKKSEDQARLLADAIEKGFPDRHHLVITTDTVDRRKALYNTIKDKGTVVDCSVPKGDRKADKDVQDALLRDTLARMLGAARKTMDPAVFPFLCDMTGFDIRSYSANIEKLITYAGPRDRITLEDARTLLRRTKQDPIFELSGAIAERNLEGALFYTGSLLANGIFPLQVLAAVTNQVRRLLVAKDFVLSLPQGAFGPSMDFNRFKTSIIPLVKDYDTRNAAKVSDRETRLSEPPEPGKKEKRVKAETDLVLAKNPNNPYPVFLLLKNSCKYSLDDLYAALEDSFRADLRLKGSGEPPRLILEDLLFRICGPREA